MCFYNCVFTVYAFHILCEIVCVSFVPTVCHYVMHKIVRIMFVFVAVCMLCKNQMGILSSRTTGRHEKSL